MKGILKKAIALLAVLTLCINIGKADVNAAGSAQVIIALSSSNISIGNTVTATVSVSGSDVSAYQIYVTYDSSVLEYQSGSGSATVNGSGGTLIMTGTGSSSSASITFKAISNGSCYISTSGTEAYDLDSNAIAVNHAGANVTVGTTETTESNEDEKEDDEKENDENKDERSSNCKLKSLKISDGELKPKFSADKTSYFVQLDEDAESIIVSAETEDSKAKTSVTGADKLKPGENIVKVTVTAENGAEKVYTIKVACGEIEEGIKVTVDNKEYSIINDASGLIIPEGFSAENAKYKDKEILTYVSPNKKIVLVCLENDELEQDWYIIDIKKDTFTRYEELASSFNRYIIKDIPEQTILPAGYEKTKVKIGYNEVTAYQNEIYRDSEVYLVYAMNISKDEGFYLYDAIENTFVRYVLNNEQDTAINATPTDAKSNSNMDDDGIFTKEILIILLAAVSLVCVLLVLIIFLGRARRKSLIEELSVAEEMVSQFTENAYSVDSSKLGQFEKIGNEIPEETKTKKQKKEEEYINKRRESLEQLAEKMNKSEKKKKSEEPKTYEVKKENKTVPDTQEIKSLMSEIDRIMAETEMYKNGEEINDKNKSCYDAEKDSAF